MFFNRDKHALVDTSLAREPLLQPYAPDLATYSSTPGHRPLVPQNHVLRRYQIRDTFLIDPSLPGEGKNLVLRSPYHSVRATVYLVGVLRGKKKVEIDVHANHSLTFELYHRSRGLPIHLSFLMKHPGPTTIGLPSDFCGPIKIISNHARVKILPSLARNVRTLSESDGVRLCWVGAGGPEAAKGEWEGDECEIRVRWGSLIIGFWDDRPVEVLKHSGWRKLFHGAK